MFAMAAHWTFKAGSGDEVLDVNKDEVMPALEARPGYVRGFIVQTGTDSFLSVVCWETEDDAKRALAEMAPLVIRHLGHLVRDVERFPGPVVYERSSKSSRLERTLTHTNSLRPLHTHLG